LLRRIALAAACVAILATSVVIGRDLRAAEANRPIYYVQTREKVMALTFDLSWGTKMLSLVLPILEQAHQPATFFVSGPYARTHPDEMKAIMDAGMELASHGAAHVNFSGLSTAGVEANVRGANADLQPWARGPLDLLRPPNGDWSPSSVAAARAAGYETIVWSIDSLDWMNPGVGTIVSRVTKQAFPGAIILLHASDTCKQTNLALPTILTDLKAQGYRLVTLGELMKMGPAARDDPRGSGRKPNTD
jgi:polysaccharide deacetylase family sporulation protein PdaB